MKTKNMRIGLPMVVATGLLATIGFTSCNKDNSNNNSGSGTTSTTIKVTDAPIDDASISGAFVTISDIKLDGQSIQGFTKTTVDLNALQNGTTQTIGTFNVNSGTYSSITFVLDNNTDASGNSPGSYILTTGGVKNQLSSATSISISKNIFLQTNNSNTLVADFDLRKMIVHQTGGGSNYAFATAAELNNDVRLAFESGSGTISGTLTDNVSNSTKVVAYLYKKGTFNRSTELQGQGSSNVQFANAISSDLVGSNGSYEFHYVENGDYEIHFASYKDTNADGIMDLQGTLVATGSLDLLNLTLNAGASVTVNATATAVLP